MAGLKPSFTKAKGVIYDRLESHCSMRTCDIFRQTDNTARIESIKDTHDLGSSILPSRWPSQRDDAQMPNVCFSTISDDPQYTIR